MGSGAQDLWHIGGLHPVRVDRGTCRKPRECRQVPARAPIFRGSRRHRGACRNPARTVAAAGAPAPAGTWMCSHDSGREAHILLIARATGFYPRSEEHTSELQSLMRISYAVFCLTKKNISILFYIYIHLI